MKLQGFSLFWPSQLPPEAVSIPFGQFKEASHLRNLYNQFNRVDYDLYTAGGEAEKRRPNESKAAFEVRLKALQERLEKQHAEIKEALRTFSNNPKKLRKFERLWKDGTYQDTPKIRRQIEILYNQFLEGSIDPQLKAAIDIAESELGTMYNNFRPVYNGKKRNDNFIENQLKKQTDPEVCRKLWEARFEIGNYREKPNGLTIAQKIIETVELRNTFARKAGYKNYYEFGLAMKNTTLAEVNRILEEVTEATELPFQQLRAKLDELVMKRYGVSKEEARLPWLQAGIDENGLIDLLVRYNPDKYLNGVDPRPLIKKAGQLMGINVDDIVDNSDLFTREGKTQHWYMYPINAPKDLRTIGNLEDERYRTRMAMINETLEHEILGHGGGYRLINGKYPGLLRDHDTIVTECDAMMLETLHHTREWLEKVLHLDKKKVDEVVAKATPYIRANSIIFFRGLYLRIVDFEKQMYENPRQDLNKLWSQLTEKYLGIKSPTDKSNPDWAFKVHFALHPVYYQSYLLGQVMRAQVEAHIKHKYQALLTRHTGEFLKAHRQHGLLYPWPEVVKRMTGEDLNAAALKAEFQEVDFSALELPN